MSPEEYAAEKRAERALCASLGVCVRCHKRDAAPGWTECQRCKDRQRYERRASGIGPRAAPYRCGVCLAPGHNALTCPERRAGSRP